jgi:transcription elongation GreA/GreB family factor
VSKSFVKEDA